MSMTETPVERAQVGLAGGPKSGVRHFDPIREAGEDSKEPLVVTLIADFGTQEPGNVLPQLIRHTQDATHDLVIHVGMPWPHRVYAVAPQGVCSGSDKCMRWLRRVYDVAP